MRLHSHFTTMVPKIYTSPFAPVPVRDRSIFTHLFNTSKDPNDVGGFPASYPALVDAPTGTTLTRGQLKKLALSFGCGIMHHPNLRARTGDTIMIYSQNSMAWPVVLFGAGRLPTMNGSVLNFSLMNSFICRSRQSPLA